MLTGPIKLVFAKRLLKVRHHADLETRKPNEAWSVTILALKGPTDHCRECHVPSAVQAQCWSVQRTESDTKKALYQFQNLL